MKVTDFVFDFSHFEAMTTEQIKQAEDIVNEKILESIDVTVQELPIEEAKKAAKR